MINTKRSYTEYNVLTPTTDFVIGFDNYNADDKDVIHVTLNGVDVTTLGYTVRRESALTLKVTPAIASGVVRLQRETIIDAPFHAFTAGALFTAKSMDENFAQTSHMQQEIKDKFTFVEQNIDGVLAQTIAAKDGAIVATTAANLATGKANTATSAANSAAAGAVLAKTNADTATGLTQAATAAANTATGNVNAAISAANVAKTAADVATGKANTATGLANTATGLATTATGLANTATGRANTAAGLAETAADRVAGLEEGKAATIASVTAVAVATGVPPTVDLGGTPQNRTFKFNIPAGAKGTAGAKGADGARGLDGAKGADGVAGQNIINQRTGYGLNVWTGARWQYDNIPTKDSNTLYMVTA